jgi:O-antigen/teichoic acid export membrane protein
VLDVIKRRLRQIKVGGIGRSIGVLVGGTAFAQALSVLALPVLTRLYTPEDFSVLAVYTALLGILTVIASLRLEIAIPLPEADSDAANLLAIALCSSAAFGALLGVVVAFWGRPISLLLDAPQLARHLWLLPLGVWIAGSYMALQYWTSRRKNFSAVARTRMSQAIGGTITQLGLGALSIAPLGLLLGQFIKSGAGVVGLGRRLLLSDRAALSSVNRGDMVRVLSEYRRFPKYSMLEAFANTASIQVPVLIIAASSPGHDAGYLLLAMQVLAIPAALIGQAVGQVFLSHAAEKNRSDDLAAFTAKTIGNLIAIGAGPILAVAILAPTAFPLLFGQDWARSGHLVTWMAPWFFMQFVTSPVSMVLHIRSQQRTALLLQLGGLALRAGMVAVSVVIAPHLAVEVYAISGLIFYLIYAAIVVAISKSGLSATLSSTPKPALVGSLMLAAIAALATLVINRSTILP